MIAFGDWFDLACHVDILRIRIRPWYGFSSRDAVRKTTGAHVNVKKDALIRRISCSQLPPQLGLAQNLVLVGRGAVLESMHRIARFSGSGAPFRFPNALLRA